MLGGIAFPGVGTLAWMVVAAAAGAGFVLRYQIRRRLAEWRIARRKANGEDTSYEEWELERYQPDAPSEEERRTASQRAAWTAIYMAISVWTSRDLSPELGEIMISVAAAVFVLSLLLRDFRKTDDELGVNSLGRDPMQGPPTFLERYGKRLREIGAALLGLGLLCLFLFGDELFGQENSWIALAIAGTIIVASMLYNHFSGEPEPIDYMDPASEDSEFIGMMMIVFFVVVFGIGVLLSIS